MTQTEINDKNWLKGEKSATPTSFLYVDVLVPLIYQDQNIEANNCQPTLWLSSAIEVDWS
jgi:hypothetical protein